MVINMTVAFGDISIYLAETEHGTFLAATNKSPYFCFEAETEGAIIALVTNALRFYHANINVRVTSTTQRPTVTRFLPQRIIDSRDLLSA